MSWPGSSRPGSSLSLHHRSWCPKPGIIGSDSTWEVATTARSDPSTGILLWNCTKRACVWILVHFLRLWLFFFCQNCTCYLQCGLISKHEYVRWRERGLAFEMREGAYQITNPTLISSRVFNQVILYLLTLPTSLIWYNFFWFCLDSKGTKWLWEVTGETSFPVPSSHSASKPMTRVCWRNRMGNTSRSAMDF